MLWRLMAAAQRRDDLAREGHTYGEIDAALMRL